MVRFLGLVFIGLLASAGILTLDVITKSNYSISFLTNQSLQIVGTIIALNVATVTFLLNNLSSIEREVDKELFVATRREIKQNIYTIIAIFPLLLAVNISINHKVLQAEHLQWSHILLSGLGLLLVFFVIYSMFEIISSVFEINRFPNNKK